MAQLLDGVILIDPSGVLLSANPSALAMHGVERMEDLGVTAEDYASRFTMWSTNHRALKRREYPLFRLLAGEELPDTVVEVAPAGEDEARWVHEVRDVTMDVDGGEPDYLALVISDVSERFDAEARFKAMFTANPAPAMIIAIDTLRISRLNPGFLSLTGYKPDQLVGRSPFALDLLSELPDKADVRRRIEAGEVIPQTQAELLVADGSRRLVVFAGQPIDVTDEDAVLITFADLEPRRQAERSLADSERHLRSIFEMAPVPMAIAGADNRLVTDTNAALRALLGDADSEADQIADPHCWWKDANLYIALSAAALGGQSIRKEEATLITPSGDEITCLVSAEVISVSRSACVLWVFEDISERRRSEAELGEAIDAVLRDATWLSRSILDKLATLRRPDQRAVDVQLSSREREILSLICDDLDDEAIAAELSIARNTVRNHVARIYAKIGVNRRSGAVVWGRERGLGSHVRSD